MPGSHRMSKAGREARFSTTLDRFHEREAVQRSGKWTKLSN